MNPTCSRGDCAGCSSTRRFVCHCLQVTEAAILEALATHSVESVRDLQRCTGAGEGCTACHQKLRNYIERHALVMATEPLSVAG